MTQSSDIIQALRDVSCSAGCNTLNVCACALCEDAADEIERLRAALKEIAELGPAGEEIRCDSLEASEDGDKDFNLYDQGFCEAWRRAGNIARAVFEQLTNKER